MSPCPPKRSHRYVVLAILMLVGIGDVAAQTVTAQRGEGIWALLRRSGVSPNNQRVAAFKELNADRLRGGEQLVLGRSYRLPDGARPAETVPAATTGRRYEIFGKDYEMVVRKSTRLAGHVYYVVSGHGGPDPGAVQVLNGRQVAEDEIAYDTALRLARALLEDGAKVYMIVRDRNDGIRDAEYLPHDKDEYYWGDLRIPLNQERRLRRRADVINDLYEQNKGTARSQQVIAVHVDSYASTRQPQIDVHFAYASDSGRSLGRTLQAEIRDQYEAHQPGRGYNGRVRQRDLYILNETKPTAVLVELGNLRHRGDRVRLVKPGNRQALAEWIAEGLVRRAESTSGGRRAE